jgi:predicted O-linked N-acetylglucosamine transferase (SPINDLY family)
VTSHTTASDALWAGVPLLTRLGETFASRVAASLLRTLGLPELVTGDETGYFDLALALARDPGRLAALRARVGQQRLASPLFDTPRFTRDLERLLLAIWDQACSGRRGHVVLDTPRNP